MGLVLFDRSTIFSKIYSILDNNTVVLVLGKGLCSDVKGSFNESEYNNIFYFPDDTFLMSFPVGIAVGTSKKVIVVCEDYLILKDLSGMAQAAVSKCINLSYIVILTYYYQDCSQNMPTLFKSLTGPRSLFFDMGFLINDYNSYIVDESGLNKLKSMCSKIKGPSVSFIKSEFSSKRVSDGVVFSEENITYKKLKSFLAGESNG